MEADFTMVQPKITLLHPVSASKTVSLKLTPTIKTVLAHLTRAVFWVGEVDIKKINLDKLKNKPYNVLRKT